MRILLVGSEDIFQLDSIGIEKEDSIIAGFILWIVAWWIENRCMHNDQALVEIVNRKTCRSRKSDVVHAWSVTTMRDAGLGVFDDAVVYARALSPHDDRVAFLRG